MEEKWSIDKLDGNNYWSTWKFQMKHLLLAKALWGLVDGSEALEGDAAAERTEQFRLKSQKTFSTITQLYLVTSCEDPKQTRDTLRNYFEFCF